VATEAIKERESMTDLAKRFEVHPAQITTWEREFLERADQAFGGTSDAQKLMALESERDDLYRKVGVFPPKILNKQKDNFRFLGNEDEPIQRKPNHQGHQGARRWPESRGHCS
jgi:hypothetical protein